MLKRLLSTCIVLSFFLQIINAQIVFSGTVKDRTDSSFLQGASITNTTSHQSTSTDKLGAFNINADFNDKLIITSVGYAPDTLLVQPQLFLRSPVIFLAKQFSSLKSVTVFADRHATDSLESRANYRAIFEDKRDRIITRRSVKGDPGFGIILSPLSYFSARAKARRKLAKRLNYSEQQDYVDYRFPSHLISRYTGLKGDSLRTFMLKYRPTYKYCITATDEDILFYVNDCLKKYLHPPVPSGAKRRKG